MPTPLSSKAVNRFRLGILMWATFGFLGLGLVGAGTVESWGQMVYDAYVNLALLWGMWWYFVPPILCIFLAVLGPALLSLQLKWIALQTPRNAVPVEAAPRVVSVLPVRP